MDDKTRTVRLYPTGSYAGAMLGPNLAYGQVEFVPVPGWPHAGPEAEEQAMLGAYWKLVRRLGIEPPPYERDWPEAVAP